MKKTITIGSKKVGDEHPCFIIAEACDNHLGNLDVAKEMALQAKLFGADAVKFQHHLPDEEMVKEEMVMSDNFDMHLYDFLKKHALTIGQHKELINYCNSIGIIYLCTPFSTKAALELNELGVPAFKIGSGEMTDLPSLKVIAALGKPMIVSTGMSTLEEIDETVKELTKINKDIIIMNCTSEYPPNYADMNLGVIDELKKRYDLIIGHSDHTPDIYTSIAAVAKGAKLIEKHFILNKLQKGPDQSVSIEPFEFHNLVSAIRKVELALGSNKKVNKLEQPIRSWAFRSVVTLKEISKGNKINKDDVWTKRPGTGIPAKEMEKVIGKIAKVDLKKNHLVKWDELK